MQSIEIKEENNGQTKFNLFGTSWNDRKEIIKSAVSTILQCFALLLEYAKILINFDCEFLFLFWCLNHRNGRSVANSSAKPPADSINIVDVSTIVRSSNTNKRTYSPETQTQSKMICTECIIQDARLMTLRVKRGQIQQQLIELEKENEMLKSQLNPKAIANEPIHVPISEDIPPEHDENCKICSATLTQHELSTHMCIDLDEVSCEYCSQPFESTMDLWHHLIDSAVHHDKKWHRCSICLNSFPAAVLLKCHKDVKHPQWQNKCKFKKNYSTILVAF